MNTTDPEKVIQFIEKFCKLTRGTKAGEPVRLRPFQKDIIRELISQQPRRALLGLPRKSGKSALAAWIALYALVADGETGAEVLGIAGSREQASLVLEEAKRCVQLSPTLAKHLVVERYRIKHPASGSVYKVLSAKDSSAEGYNPSLAIADELHVFPDSGLYDALSLASAAREHPLLLAITTAGVRYTATGADSPAYVQYQYGKRLEAGELIDPHFWFRWYEPKNKDADYRSPETWAEANPAYGDFQSPEDFEAACLVTTEAEFKTKRLNMWVASHSAWLAAHAWEACNVKRDLVPGEEVWLGFDGSFSNDSTAVVAATSDGYIEVVGLWEKPLNATHAWRVEIEDVEDKIRELCGLYKVREIACDPYRWARSMQVLLNERLPIVEYPQTPSRMIPATVKFYDAVMDGKLSHNGDPALARHIANTTAKQTAAGVHVQKEHKDSKRKIDITVASIMAYDRAIQNNKPPQMKIW